MAKKHSKGSSKSFLDNTHPLYSANKELSELKFQDLQGTCISMGMTFEDVVHADRPRLESWFCKNYGTKRNKGLLEDFDIWMQKLLAKKYGPDDPFVKFRRFSKVLEDGTTKATQSALKRAKIKKEKKPKRQRDSKFGIFIGTKKAYTYYLANDLYDKFKDKYNMKEIQKGFADKLVTKVVAKFPEAQEKSVKIWMTRALKELNGPKKDNIR